MQLLRRDPDKAYYSNVLALPKRFVSEQQLHGALSFELKDGEIFRAYSVEGDHVVVPRNYIEPSALGSLPFPVVDARIRSFPRIRFGSKVVLDAKSNGLSYQREGVDALLNTNNGILCLRCGAGKTVSSLHAISRLEVPGLILVNDLGLAEQWYQEIRDFTDLEPADIGFVGAGRFDWQHKLTIAVVHTLAGRVRNGTLPPELVRHFGVVLSDEAHTTSGPAFYHLAVTPFHGWRWGLSATPRREDAFDALLRYTMGPVVYRYLVPELTPLVYFRLLPTLLDTSDRNVRRAVCARGGELHFGKLYGYFATRDDRMRIIEAEVREALRLGRQVLILSQSRPVLDRLQELFPEGGVVHGGVTSRQERFRRIKECNPVIAISKLGRQALNKPSLDTVFVLEPYTKHGILQQLIGRIQRTHPDKQVPTAVFYDDVGIGPVHAMCLKIRGLFNRWPEDQGGRLKWQDVAGPENAKVTSHIRR